MSIEFDKAPVSVPAAAAFRLASRESERLRGPASGLRIAPPVAIYRAWSDDELPELRPSHLKRIAWRCFAVRGDEVVAAADVKRKSGRWLATRLAAGDTVKRTVDAIAAAEEEAGERRMRIRLFQVPWLFFNAVWMSADSEHRLLIIDAPGTELPRYVSEENPRSFDWETVRDALADFSRARTRVARVVRTFSQVD